MWRRMELVGLMELDKTDKIMIKIDTFLFITIAVSIFSYYQIRNLYHTQHQETINISILIGMGIAGLVFLVKNKKGDKKID